MCMVIVSCPVTVVGGGDRLSSWASFSVGARVCRGAPFDYLNHSPLRTHIPHFY